MEHAVGIPEVRHQARRRRGRCAAARRRALGRVLCRARWRGLRPPTPFRGRSPQRSRPRSRSRGMGRGAVDGLRPAQQQCDQARRGPFMEDLGLNGGRRGGSTRPSGSTQRLRRLIKFTEIATVAVAVPGAGDLTVLGCRTAASRRERRCQAADAWMKRSRRTSTSLIGWVPWVSTRRCSPWGVFQR